MASPTFANGCDDLWFTRNLLFDRAGYCFGSPLGQAVFNNADCVSSNIVLNPQAKQFADYLRGLEAQHQCRVDTSRRSLALDDLHIRRQLYHLPVAVEFGSGCLNWLMGPTPLYAAPDASTPIIGQIQPSNNVYFFHEAVGSWTYVTVNLGGTDTLVSGGWLGVQMSRSSCEQQIP